jgi:ParB family chromosome partitioning protein
VNIDAVPPATIAAVLDQLASSKYPRMDLPNLAARHGLTLNDLQRLVTRHGYPDPATMRAAAGRLRDYAVAASPPRAEPGRPLQAPIGSVLPDPDNLRDELHGIDELAESISSIGMLEPIVVRRRGQQFVIVAGHRRRAAAALLQHVTVPVVIADLRAEDVLVAMLIENGQREDLDPIEEARGLEKLRTRGETPLAHAEVAKMIGRTQAYVSNRLALLALPADEQAAIRAGHMPLREGVTRGRHAGGTHRPGMVGKASAAHFDRHHRLADVARALCRTNGHSKHVPGGMLGGVACGRCWEAVIRSDEADKIARRSAS